MTPRARFHRARATVLLIITAAGTGLLVAAAIGAAVLATGFALRNAVGA